MDKNENIFPNTEDTRDVENIAKSGCDIATDEAVILAARDILDEYRAAFDELAK